MWIDHSRTCKLCKYFFNNNDPDPCTPKIIIPKNNNKIIKESFKVSWILVAWLFVVIVFEVLECVLEVQIDQDWRLREDY